MSTLSQQPLAANLEDYITIVAHTTVDAMKQFRAQGLDKLGYSIIGPVAKHNFHLANSNNSETTELFEGTPMVAATFKRQKNS